MIGVAQMDLLEGVEVDVPALWDATAIPELSVLSYGAGQDSTAILAKLIHDPEFRGLFAPRRLLILMSATGDEHPETDDHVEYTKDLCRQNDIEFHHIVPSLGFHSPGWQSLRGFYRAHNACGSKAFPKTCTHRLKLQPIYRFLEAWLGDRYGVQIDRKRGFYGFRALHGKVRMLVGIAKGEERRIADPLKEAARWKRETVETVYPLVEVGMDRQACQDYIRSVGMPVPSPSNCMLCPFASERDLLWLYRFRPDDYRDWVDIERKKLDAFSHLGDRNLGVWGAKTLPEVLEDARRKFGHLSDDDLMEYKFSHGHCAMSRY